MSERSLHKTEAVLAREEAAIGSSTIVNTATANASGVGA